MKKYPKQNASVESANRSVAEVKRLWNELVEREVQTRKLMHQIAASANESDVAFMQTEIQRRKHFMLELICNEMLSDS